MTRIYIAGLFLLFGMSLSYAQTPAAARVVSACAGVTYTAGANAPITVDTTGKLCSASAGSGTSDVNVAQVAGATVATGHGTAAGALRVELPTDGTGKVGIDQTTPGTTNAVVAIPASVSGTGTAPVVSGAAEGTHVLKASAGNLYNLTVTIGATSGYVMVFNATSAPADGAVTPVWCAAVNSNGTNGSISAAWPMPLYLGTGISVAFSTTGCFTKTASNASFFGGVQ